MTSLIKPVPQREIEEKKQGSGERTAQILKKKAKGRIWIIIRYLGF